METYTKVDIMNDIPNIMASLNPLDIVYVVNGISKFISFKTRPKVDIFKCYVCCKNDKTFHLVQTTEGSYTVCDMKEYGEYGKYLKLLGDSNNKVIFEFICKNICPQYYTEYIHGYSNIFRYHFIISDLIVYDNPKNIDRFIVIDKNKMNVCKHRFQGIQLPDICNGGKLYGAYICDDKVSFCNGCKDVYKPLIKPPSTWRYIVGENEYDEICDPISC